MIILESTQGSTRTISLNRPDRRNAMSVELSRELALALRRASQDPEIRVVLIRGEGRAFSAGGDIKLMQSHREQSEQLFLDITQHLNEAIRCIATMPQVVIAVVEGPAFAAGFGLAMACDMVVATSSAKLSPSFINIGLSPNASSTFVLPRVLGRKRAAEAFFFGEIFDAQQAQAMGMVNRVWDEAELETQLKELADQLRQRPRGAMARIKKLLHSTYELGYSAQLDNERREISQSSLSEDFTEGITAFLEKRPPKYK